MYHHGGGVLISGKAVHVGQGREHMGNLTSPQFCCEPKTALNKWMSLKISLSILSVFYQFITLDSS